MADKTGIEWTDATWNPVVGCSLVSPGCTNCYAMSQASRLLDKPGSHYEGTTKKVNGKPVWTGQTALAPDHILTQPLRWKRPRRVFVNSMGDLFHESMSDGQIAEIFDVMIQCPHHIFQILTKRPARMYEYITQRAMGDIRGIDQNDLKLWPLKNVWLGVSVEDQKRADERIPLLLRTPAAVRFLSCEPLLGPVNLNRIVLDECAPPEPLSINALCRWYDGVEGRFTTRIDWVIAGGERGPDARPMHPDWARSIRDQCQAAQVPFFFKQWGEWMVVDHISSELAESLELQNKYFYMRPDGSCRGEGGNHFIRIGKKQAGRNLDGFEWNQYPEEILEKSMK